MPATPKRSHPVLRLALLITTALAGAVGAAGPADADLPGATYEHLQLPLDASAWDVTFDTDDGSALWHYRHRADASAFPSHVDAFTATAMPRSRAPFAARDLPRRMHAVLAAHVPDLALDIVHSGEHDDRYRAVYVMASASAGTGAIVGLVEEGTDALHSVEIELHAAAPASERVRWVETLWAAELRPAVDGLLP